MYTSTMKPIQHTSLSSHDNLPKASIKQTDLFLDTPQPIKKRSYLFGRENVYDSENSCFLC